MATYFSINDGNFNTATVFATTLATGDVTAGTIGNVITTSFSYPTTLATSNGSTYGGVALQLSAINGAPTGTIDLILSGTDGSSTGTLSYPISGMTLYTSTNNIAPTYPLGWQFFEFPAPITIANAKTMRVGVKTSVSNKVSLIGTALTNLNRYYVTTINGTPNAATDVTHIVGNLTTSGLINKNVMFNIPGNIVSDTGTTLGNLYIHNGGVLNFDHEIDVHLTLSGTLGMQITPNGTVNIGTSTNPIVPNKIHKIKLNNCYINVHNGATLNTYGSYKPSYAFITQDAPVGVTEYAISINPTNWRSEYFGDLTSDILIITTNTSAYNAFEVPTYFAQIQPNGNILVGGDVSKYEHTSSNYIPSIVNMSRNVKFEATNNVGYIRFLDGSNSSLNNTEFKGFRNATYKGLQFGINSSGSVSLSNCAFNGNTTVASMPAFTFIATKSPISNVSIIGCNFYGYGLTTDIISINAISANNFTFTDNIVLSASQNGMLINGLSSTYSNIKNNFIIGSKENGLKVLNPYLISGSIGGIGCMNNICGVVVAGTNNRANYDNLVGLYNTTEGVNILGTIPQLSSTTFKNLTASNNKTSGVLLSGNANNLFSPIRININGLVANENKESGLEGYAITGNLSSMYFDSNLVGNVTVSIGNANTIFDGITSKNTIPYYTVPFNSGASLTTLSDSPFVGLDGSLSSNATTTSFLSVLNSDLSFSEDFTIECWIKTNIYTLDTRSRRIFGFGSNLSNGLQLLLGINDTSVTPTLTLFSNTSLIAGGLDVCDNQWHHIAVSRVNGVMKLFVDGSQDGDSINNTTNFDIGDTLPLFIFRYAGGANGRFNGSISNFRIMSKTGLYSEDFVKPSKSFDVILNTTLLVNESDYNNKTYKNLNKFSNIDILSGRNYSATLFRNSNITGNVVNAIKLNNTKFEQFSMDSSTLSSNYEDIGSSSSVDFLQGSYQFNNCTFGTGILSSTIQNYQPEVFTENGFVVMKEKGVANKHYRLLRAGKISLDETLAKTPNTVSEKLEPTSTITKLRCGSKMIPVNKNASYTIGCYVYKSSGYSGAAPRLMLKHNSALGYVDTVLATSVGADETWELLTGSVPAALDQGIFEVYVDCSGESGSGSVNIDNWILTLV